MIDILDKWLRIGSRRNHIQKNTGMCTADFAAGPCAASELRGGCSNKANFVFLLHSRIGSWNVLRIWFLLHGECCGVDWMMQYCVVVTPLLYSFEVCSSPERGLAFFFLSPRSSRGSVGIVPQLSTMSFQTRLFIYHFSLYSHKYRVSRHLYGPELHHNTYHITSFTYHWSRLFYYH